VSLDEILTRDELMTRLRNFSCAKCSYKPAPDDECFLKEGESWSFECPKCGAVWSIAPEKVN
jgi:uncharacterized Zn finger protein